MRYLGPLFVALTCGPWGWLAALYWAVEIYDNPPPVRKTWVPYTAPQKQVKLGAFQ